MKTIPQAPPKSTDHSYLVERSKAYPLSLSRLPGYCPALEIKRQQRLEEFLSAETADAKRAALRSHASLTGLRCSTFVKALERGLGLRDA